MSNKFYLDNIAVEIKGRLTAIKDILEAMPASMSCPDEWCEALQKISHETGKFSDMMWEQLNGPIDAADKEGFCKTNGNLPDSKNADCIYWKESGCAEKSTGMS